MNSCRERVRSYMVMVGTNKLAFDTKASAKCVVISDIPDRLKES